MNVIGLRDEFSNATKLAYLSSYLSDYALSIIIHLSIINDNYPIAMELLKKEILNKNLTIAKAYEFKIKNSVSNSYDTDFIKTKTYINDMRSMIFELKNYDLDFMIKDSPGNSLLSHILFGNLPLLIKKQLISVLNSNSPTLDQIFDHYHNVIETLMQTSRNMGWEKNNNNKGDSKFSFRVNKTDGKPSALQNFSTTSETIVNQNVSKVTGDKYCKLCQMRGHMMINCVQFDTLKLRIKRAKQLNLCELCSSAGHSTERCFGNQNNLKYGCHHCQSKSHIAPFCPDKFKEVEQVVNNMCLSLNNRIDINMYCPHKQLRSLVEIN